MNLNNNHCSFRARTAMSIDGSNNKADSNLLAQKKTIMLQVIIVDIWSKQDNHLLQRKKVCIFFFLSFHGSFRACTILLTVVIKSGS